MSNTLCSCKACRHGYSVHTQLYVSQPIVETEKPYIGDMMPMVGDCMYVVRSGEDTTMEPLYGYIPTSY